MTIENEIIVILKETPGLSAFMISERLKDRFHKGRLARLLSAFSSSSTLYPALAKMERQGLLRSQWGLQVTGRPRRRLYFLANPPPPS